MPAKTIERPKTAPETPSLKSDQESRVARARLDFKGLLNRRRRGFLQTVITLPLDIVYEIFSQLRPQDLYNLLQTSKLFYDILSRKQHRFIWRNSFANVNFPPCPEGIIEPVWVRTFYSSTCSLCGEPNIDTVTWQCLARLCDTCLKKPLISECRVHTILKKPQYEQFKKLAESRDVFIRIPVVTGFARPCYVRSHVIEVMKAWEDVPEPREALLSSFIQEWQKKEQERIEFVAKCREYMTLDASKHRAELRAIRDQRLKDICEGLRALGWGLEVDYVKERDFDKFRPIESVWHAKELTGAAWNDMRGDLVDCVKAVRAELRAAKLQQRWYLFAEVGSKLLGRSSRRHPDMAAYRFSIQDFAMQDEVRQILDVPEDAKIAREDLQVLEGKFEKIFKRWRAELCKQLRDAAAKTACTTKKGTDPLQLATTVFTVCRHGHNDGPEYVLFPFLTAHRCVRSTLTGASDAYERFVHRHSSRPKGQTCHYVGCPDLRQAEVTPSMRKIVQLFGLDPDTATVAQMDAVNARLVVNWRDCMTWRAAMKEAAAGKVSLMKLATDRELPRIKRREKQLRLSLKAWICGRCDASGAPRDREAIERHLKIAHGIQPARAMPRDLVFLDGLAQELMTNPQLFIKWVHLS